MSSTRIKGWTWADWSVGGCNQQYGTLTINSQGRGHFECVSSAGASDGVEYWWAGFSLETKTGVSVHTEPPRQGAAMDARRPGAPHRWSFEFTFDASQFDRITRAVQHANGPRGADVQPAETL